MLKQLRRTYGGSWTRLLLLGLLLSACGSGEPGATPVPPSATPPPVPPITNTPPPTLTPAPSPTSIVETPAPDPLPDPAGFSDTVTLISWLRDAYGRGLAPDDVAARLTAACWLPQPQALRYGEFDPLWVVDLAGSGAPQWVLTIRAIRGQRPDCDADPIDNGAGGLWVLDGGGLLYELSPLELGFWLAPRVAGAVDLSGDGLDEIIVESIGCGAHTCSSAFFVLSTHGGTGIRSVLDLASPNATAVSAASDQQVGFMPLVDFTPDNGVALTSATVTFDDVTGDGVADVSLHGGGISSAGAGLHRTFTEVWSWVEGVARLRQFIWHNAPARHHALYAGNYHYALGKPALAREFYLRVIYDESLSDEFAFGYIGDDMLGAGRAATRQYAAFRLTLLAVEQGLPAEAAVWRDWLAETYPEAPLTAAAAEILADAGSGLPLATSCARITIFLQGEPRPTGVLENEVGYGNPSLDAASVCPVGRAAAPTTGAAEPIHDPLPLLGVAAVDAAIVAALASDGDGLAAQATLRSYECVGSGMGALICLPDEAPGTEIEGFVISGCDGYIERDLTRMSAVLADAARAARGLVGVTVSASGDSYRIGLATAGAGLVLSAAADGIYGINLGCDRPAAEMLYDWPEATFLLSPPGEP